jgi:glycosyltransferase involved in cell wall biosynthesis
MDRPIRIAFLSEHASPVALLGGVDAGGQNVYVDEVSRNLATLGYAVDVFTRRDKPDAPEIIDWAPGVRVIHLAAGPAEFLLKDTLWQYMPEFRDSFLRFLEQNELHYDLIHSNFWMSGWVATELKRLLEVPVVHIFHAMGKTKQRHQGKDDSSPAERIEVESAVIRNVDRLIAQCPTEQAELIDDYSADLTRVVVIPSAVNIDVFKPEDRVAARRVAGVADDDFVVVYVGRMLPRKDVRNVVRGVASLLQLCRERQYPLTSKIKLLLVGGETAEPDPIATPEIGVLQRLVAELGIDEHVHFIGKRQQDSLRYYYSAGDVAVTTPWYEPFGLTPLEGMACGRPVIGSAVGGITFTLVDGQTGFLVEPRNPEMLAVRLYQSLTEPELREHMGRVARLRVEREFTWSTVARRTAHLYSELITQSAQQNFSLLEDASPVGGE